MRIAIVHRVTLIFNNILGNNYGVKAMKVARPWMLKTPFRGLGLGLGLTEFINGRYTSICDFAFVGIVNHRHDFVSAS